MKKIISSILFMLSVGIFFWLSSYTSEWPFDYHISEFIWYLFYWNAALFTVSLFALVLDERKYKMWLLLSVIFATISVFGAWQTGDGNGAILSFDGELVTWFLAGLYSLISIIYFIVQFVKNKK